MGPTQTRVVGRVYTQFIQRLLQAILAVAAIIYIIELALIEWNPELGLRLLWFATIPLAPMILLVAPNAWVSVCPISTVQTWSHRLGRNPRRRLSTAATRHLQTIGWGLMLLGIPTRHLVFNTVGWATFWTAVAITGVVLAAGFLFRSLSGWCVGACPIRPIEALYGQFALDRNRPEKCTTCTACIAHCLRLVPERSHDELYRSKLIANMAIGFPGFVAAYFLLDLLDLCVVEHKFFAGTASTITNWIAQINLVYGVMFGGFVASWLVFRALAKAGWSQRRLFRGVALSAFAAYYLGVAPEVCEAWGWPMWVAPMLTIIPAVALFRALAAERRAGGQPRESTASPLTCRCGDTCDGTNAGHVEP